LSAAMPALIMLSLMFSPLLFLAIHLSFSKKVKDYFEKHDKSN